VGLSPLIQVRVSLLRHTPCQVLMSVIHWQSTLPSVNATPSPHRCINSTTCGTLLMPGLLPSVLPVPLYV
jgi:hypothetical protein